MPVGTDWYALDVHSVDQVVAHPAVTAVPAAPPALLGLLNMSGEIVPLFDTAALLGLGLGRMPVGPFATIVRTTKGPAGLSVSGAPEPAELGDPGSTDHAGVGTYDVGGRQAKLVDLQQLLGTGPDRRVRGATGTKPGGGRQR